MSDILATDSTAKSIGLKRELKVLDLTSLGIAAIVGAGIFSTIGNAASNGGPGVIFLFMFTAIACSFSALCYAEFASNIPVAGSAYTYAYVAIGEMMAWIIGWALIMEYAVGNIAVAISWSDYFTSLLEGYGLSMPAYLTMDFYSALKGFNAVQAQVDLGASIADLQGSLPHNTVLGHEAWVNAPTIFGIKMVADLPALLITVLTTMVVYVGIKESKRASNIMVLLKIGVLLLVIAVGSLFIAPENWIPFAPNGLTGILKGVSGVFFAYIGFDAISTTAEECENPQRDLPRAMFYSLAICTILYIAVALVLTGVVPYYKLAVGDPLAYVFGPEGANQPWMSAVIAVSAVIALFSVLLVFQLGQPRIWMSMSRDGLLPKIFASIHPKYRTPWFSTIITGLLVGIPSLFFNLTEVTDLTSIGTLWAFLLVSLGALLMDHQRPHLPGRFRITYINAQYIVPILSIVAIVFLWQLKTQDGTVEKAMGSWEEFKHFIPLLAFGLSLIVLSYYSFVRKYSLIPALGVMSTGYLMTELGYYNWLYFSWWLMFGLVIYFCYGRKNSKLSPIKS